MASDPLINRERLLDKFDLLTEQEVAELFGVEVKTLKNRPFSRQPAFTKVGRARLYHRQAVVDYLARNNVETTLPSPFERPRNRRKPVPVPLPPAKPKRRKPRSSESRTSP